MKFERQFTRKGKGPYEGIRWESRVSEIRNPDGSAVFRLESAVVPSTWNAGPRDGKGQKGPYEAALVGNPVADPGRPLEVLRTVHSFDPCLACAVHMLDARGTEISRKNVL